MREVAVDRGRGVDAIAGTGPHLRSDPADGGGRVTDRTTEATGVAAAIAAEGEIIDMTANIETTTGFMTVVEKKSVLETDRTGKINTRTGVGGQPLLLCLASLTPQQCGATLVLKMRTTKSR